MDKWKSPSSVDIQKVLLDMREYRMGLIQTPDQLRFSYMAVIEGAKLILTDNSAAQVAQSQGWRVRWYFQNVSGSYFGHVKNNVVIRRFSGNKCKGNDHEMTK